MKNKDQILLEQAYSKILKEESGYVDMKIPDWDMRMRREILKNPSYSSHEEDREEEKEDNRNNRLKKEQYPNKIDPNTLGSEEEAPEPTQNNWSFVNDDINTRHYIGYSDRTFKVRGKDVLIKTELGERTDDSESWDFSLVDPETKEPVFKDIRQDQIEKHFGL